MRNDNLKLVGGKPSFIVMQSKEVFRGFEGGTPSRDARARTYDLVLMDGSYSCFAARLNSGIIRKLNGHELGRGAKITVNDHDFIWMWNEDLLETRTVMFIKDFEWEHSPALHQLKQRESLEVQSWRSSEFNKDMFDSTPLDKVMREKAIVHLKILIKII